MSIIPSTIPVPGSRIASPAEPPLMTMAKALETTFLAEMLDHAGLDQGRESFGGGIGEEQFGSFLRTEQARLMVQRGGIGLAESLFRAMGGAG